MSASLGLATAPSAARPLRPFQVKRKAKTQSVKGLIKKGQTAFDEQRYEESIQILSAALMRPGVGSGERVRVFKLLAYNYIVLQRKEEADAAVRGLLALDPEYQLPNTESPRFRDFFRDTRKRWEEEGRPGLKEEKEARVAPAAFVRLRHAPPAQVDSQMTVSLDGTVDDPKAKVDRMDIFYRKSGEKTFSRRAVKFAIRKFSAEIPGEFVEPPLVEYYFQAVDRAGLPVAGSGDAELPLRIVVAEERSIVESPWLWVPVSVAVVAAVVIPTVVLTTRQRESTVNVNVFEQ
ncbi:MAG: hypothetical protein AAGA56_05700 [Myxococcota bacterium]